MRAMGTAAVLAWACLSAPAVLAGPMEKAFYMNTYYCAGAAAAYGERLGASASHRGAGRDAERVAGKLKQIAQNYGRRQGYSESEGQRAEAQGRRTMAGLLPQNGAWSSGGNIPLEAFRQYKQCETIAEL